MAEITDAAILAQLNGGGQPARQPTRSIQTAPSMTPAERMAIERQAAADARANAAAERAAAADERANEARNTPTLKAGYRWKNGIVNGEAEPIPGITDDKGDPTGAIKKVQADAIAAYNSSQLLDQRIKEMERLYAAGPGATGALTGFQDFLPSSANKIFDEAGNSARGMVGNALAFTGGQLNTAAEAEAAVGPYLPRSENYDTSILAKIQRLKDLSELAKNRSIAQLGGVPDRNGNITPLAEVPPATPAQDERNAPPAVGGGGITRSAVPNISGLPDTGGGTQIAAPGSGTQSAIAFPGLNATVAQIIKNGGSVDDVVGAMVQAGNRPDPATINAIAKNVEAVGRPSRPYTGPLSIDVERQMVPQTGWQSIANPIAQSPLGTAAIAGGDAVTGFNLARLTGNPEQTREGIAGLAALNPKASTLGTLSGGIAAGVGGEALAGGIASRLGINALGSGAFAPRLMASDAAYGGLSGYGIGGENAGVADVIGGAGLGLAAGAGTRGLIGGLAGGIGPTGGGASPLYDQGVRPTPGQRFAGSGMFGRAINTTEQALQSLPVIGSAVHGARQAARDQFETGAFNRALSEIGDQLPAGVPHGADAFGYTRKAFNKAYDDARGGMRFVPDQQFGNDVGTFQQDVLRGGMLDSAGQQQVENAISTSLGSRLQAQGGALTGDAYKKTISDLRKKANAISKPEVQSALRQFADMTEAAARRNSDPEAVALLDRADRGYSQYAPLKEAGRMAGNEPGRFTPKNLESVERRTMGKTNSYLEGDTRMGDYITAGRNLTDTLPNSGTADRALAVGLMGGSGTFISPALPVGALAATIPYMPGVRKLTAGALAPTENPIRLNIADQLRRRQALGGMFGAPLAIESIR